MAKAELMLKVKEDNDDAILGLVQDKVHLFGITLPTIVEVFTTLVVHYTIVNYTVNLTSLSHPHTLTSSA